MDQILILHASFVANKLKQSAICSSPVMQPGQFGMQLTSGGDCRLSLRVKAGSICSNTWVWRKTRK
ncbi:hypothetical protein SLEP1_g52345 [Rubroshorea leprosula]|uniref:Uncharacterized protein n=1 Tax=Rubroshorea leprosula TaxID=152421 RepID=A0AAV5M8M8_9ROSI|nr:hypothetical protein SLEP1_g52345 [Rubroshorea leprosula]